jgi:hypothetical protein
MVRTVLALVSGTGCLAAAVLALARLRVLRRAISPNLKATRLVLTAIALIGAGLAVYVVLRRTAAMPAAFLDRGVLIVLSAGIGLLCWADDVEYPGTIRALGVVALGLAACVAGLVMLSKLPFQIGSAQSVAAGGILLAGLGLFFVALRIGRRLRARRPT